MAQAKAELLHALPPGGIGVIPEHSPELEPFVPDGLDVRRFAPPDVEVRDGVALVRFAGREIAFSFTARHQAANAVAALTVVEALGLPLPDGLVEVPFSRWRCEESQLPGGGLLINDAYNANPASMRAALEHLRRARRAAGARSPCSARWRSSAPSAPRFHEEIGAFARELGVDVIVGVGELGRRYGPDDWAPDAAGAIDARARDRRRGRHGAREGVARGRARGRRRRAGRSRRAVTRVLIAGLVALIVSILIGPRFIAFLRANEFGQHIREDGPAAPLRQAGDADDGRPADPLRGDDRLPADDALPPAGADGAVRDARLRRDRLPRRLHQADAARARSG